MNKQYFEALAGFNCWADATTRGWLQSITDKQWQMTASSSFSSIRQTAIHIVSAEKIWIDFWKGTMNPVYLSAVFNGTKNELLAIWEKVSLGVNDFINGFPESDLAKPVNFVYPDGRVGAMSYWQSFAHIVNHTTYHRGQLVTLLRQSGYDRFSSVDLATYCITHKTQALANNANEF